MKKNFFRKAKGFQIAILATFSFFMFILGSVVAVSYIRPSGSTGIDAARMQQMRETALNDEKSVNCDHS